MNQNWTSCIEACNHCAAACDECASACLHETDVAAMARCIALDLDCAQICRTAAGLMSRGSEFALEFCRTCAQICRMCAEECRKHPMDHCQRCAERCEACADECERMAGTETRERRRAAGG